MTIAQQLLEAFKHIAPEVTHDMEMSFIYGMIAVTNSFQTIVSECQHDKALAQSKANELVKSINDLFNESQVK